MTYSTAASTAAPAKVPWSSEGRRRKLAVTAAALPDRRSVAAVETFRVGSFTIAHSTNSGAVVGLNAAAARMLRWLTRRCSQDAETGHARAGAAVAADVGAALELWTRAGLFKDRPPVVAADASAVFGWQERISLHRRSVTVRSTSAAAGGVLQRVLAPLVDSASASMADGGVDFVEADGCYHIIANGEPYWSGRDFAGARHMVLQAVLETTLGPVGAVLHAGAVEMEPGSGRAVILAGTTGAGKSTLVSQLVLAGGRYLGDDLVALSPSGARVFGLPASISIKPGSARMLARQLDGGALSAADDYGLRYWRPEPVQAWRKPALLCFPRFCRGMTGAEARPLEPVEALARLLQAGGRPCGPGNSLAAMVRLCRTVPAIALEHGDGGAAMDQLRHYLDKR